MANNVLQAVTTYNKANLALLQNSFAFLSTANKKFKDFDKSCPANLGTSVEFDLAPRFNTVNSLVIANQSAEQRVQTLHHPENKRCLKWIPNRSMNSWAFWPLCVLSTGLRSQPMWQCGPSSCCLPLASGFIW